MSTVVAQESGRDRALRWARAFGPDVAVGLVVLLLGLYELRDETAMVEATAGDVYYVVVGFAIAAGLSRRAPAAGLALVWLTSAGQVVTNVPLLLVQLSAAVVAFGCARWGRASTVTVSGLSIPIGVALAVGVIASRAYEPFGDRTGLALYDLFAVVPDLGLLGLLLAATLLPLGAPWLAGLALRFLQRAQRSQESQAVAEAETAQADAARAQAQELAALRASQARLASDVHDVVGHSLAVILAQAESAQYLPDDPTTLKATLATIAGAARDSLRDVRTVLDTTRDGAPGAPAALASPAALDELVEGVRRSGHLVESHEVGRPQPLPPDLAEVAYRVLQEMLTNAMRHGPRDATIHVERHWGGDELRLEVVNDLAPDDDDTGPVPPADDRPSDRRGIVGMRRRLESVGGRLDVRRRTATFTATAWVPVRR
ncbi:histidine kinase [uncultured Nocardioides sp.]|uniref:sensor histidine kinase n=1 Tax=uncultured Nocardioides sp. TaxID=198441 RepID=UPI0026325978|nr:histidine kinase [uncultured Nocardioides sp.]